MASAARLESPLEPCTRTADEIARLVGGDVEGDPTVRVRSVAPLGAASKNHLAFVDSERHFASLRTTAAGCVIAPLAAPSLADPAGRALIRVKNPKLAVCAAIRLLHPERVPKPGVHATAVLGVGVKLGADVSIGPHAVLGDGVVVGARTVIGPGVSVGPGTRIGADSTLHANASLYHDLVIGDRVLIHSGAVIGGDGFGFVRNGANYVKFPQVGRVVLEDDVEIGANTTIDRGALGDTILRRGTKIDNLVQIGHNVELGESCAVSGQTGISGSAKIGRDVVLGGQVGIGDHSHIGDRVMLGAKSGVATGKVVASDQILLGAPARPIEEQREIFALVGLLPRLRKDLQDLKRQIREILSNGHAPQ
jgi:UDP-3-O-[3-hydroxymyristoyl] glucosamine N-acyltransferase